MVGFNYLTLEAVKTNLFDKPILFSSLALMIVQFLTIVAQPEIWQRLYAAKSLADLRKGLGFSFFLLFLIVIPLMLIGMSAKYGALITNPGNAFYEVLEFVSPAWFFPLVAVSLFAAFMSTLDSSLFAAAIQLAKNKLFHKLPLVDPDKIKARTKILMIIILAITLIASLFLADFLTGIFQLVALLTIIATVLIISKSPTASVERSSSTCASA